MPSIIVEYVAGSGFVPLLSGSPWAGWSGHQSVGLGGQSQYPVGGIQLRAGLANSGNLYVSLSGAWTASGQVGTLVGSGGPTINSGVWAPFSGTPGSGWGSMDAMPLAPGDAYWIPKMVYASGPVQLCVGTDLACSGGFGRLHFEVY